MANCGLILKSQSFIILSLSWSALHFVLYMHKVHFTLIDPLSCTMVQFQNVLLRGGAYLSVHFIFLFFFIIYLFLLFFLVCVQDDPSGAWKRAVHLFFSFLMLNLSPTWCIKVIFRNPITNCLSFLQLVSTVAWQCPDPGCATANSAGTEECSRCRLSFANAQEYLINKGAYPNLTYVQGGSGGLSFNLVFWSARFYLGSWEIGRYGWIRARWWNI